MDILDSEDDVARWLANCRYLDAEFMYKPRPQPGRERTVFDFTLHTRLKALDPEDAVLFICNSQETADSLSTFSAGFPHLRFVVAIANPLPWNGQPSDTPSRLKWETPERWQRYRMTDRWARIDFALKVASRLPSAGYLVMPAHDAVWGHDLLTTLVHFSQRYQRNGQPAAVSPYTYCQHSPIPDAGIPQDIIDLVNTAFARDSLFRWKVHFDKVQAFWGKMGIIPFGIVNSLCETTEKIMWEDDLEIDRALRELGYGVQCMWVSNPNLYRQALPVFDRAGVRTLIERTLHYSLNIPGGAVGSSTLNVPLDTLGQIRRLFNPRFARLNAEVEAIVADCVEVITRRLHETGASWVDWGAYRYVCRVGDPSVEVWKYESQ